MSIQIDQTEAVNNGIKNTCDVVDCQGNSVHYDFTAKYDGKDVPANGDPNTDMTALKKINDYTYDQTNKKGGKVTTTTHNAYARDGKSRTQTTTGVSHQGQKVTIRTVWDKPYQLFQCAGTLANVLLTSLH